MYQDSDPRILRHWLKPRAETSHKGDFGRVVIVGGSPGMAGAALLAGRAALWLGTGRVFVGLLDERIAIDFDSPELMLTSPDRALAQPDSTCLVVGPGLGLGAAARDWLIQALATAWPLVLDADALNLIAGSPELAEQVRRREQATLLTPHPGEAGRLLGCSANTVNRDRPGALARLAEHYRAGVVLKGAGSLIGFPGRVPWRNGTGNPGLAAPGMGDVLAGMIAALKAQGLEMEQAAVLGAHLHGAAADRLVAAGTGPIGLTAGEVARTARTCLNALVYN